jgi:hypothetical protein
MLPVFLMLAAREISRRDRLLFWVALVGTVSPLALAVSRVAYPDHTTAGVAAAVVWLSVMVTYRPLPSYALLAAAGALVGLLASLKYSGVQVAALFAAAFALSRTWSDLKLPRTWLAPVVCGIAAIAVFVTTNPYVLTEPERYLEAVLWHRERYGIGQPGSEADSAYLFYTEIVGLGSFGIVGAVALVVGIYAMARRNVAAALSLAGFLVFFIVSLGGYRVATNRNIMAVVPIALLFIAFGIAFVLERIPRATRNERIAAAALIALFCAEPAWRVGVQLRNDFQKDDSRVVARAWMEQNFPAGEAIGYGPTCWSYPFDPARHPVVDIRYNELRKVCLRHYVLLSWFYEHWGLGNNPISWPNMSDHMHVNVGGVSYAGYRFALNDFLKGYRLRQTFSEKRYYGPSVYIFERINACPS